MKWRYVAFGLLIVLVFVVALVVRAPATLLPALLQWAGVPSSDLRFVSPTGTLWRGESTLVTPYVEHLAVQWVVHPSSLLSRTAAIDLSLTGDLQGKVHIDAAQKQLTIAIPRLTVSEAALQHAGNRYDIQTSGDLVAESTVLTVSLPTVSAAPARVTAATGTLNWAGGPVSYMLNGELHGPTLPAMRGTFSADAASARLLVTDTGQSPRSLMRFTLDDQGLGGVAVTRDFLTLSGTTWPAGESPAAEASGADYVLEVQEKLF